MERAALDKVQLEVDQTDLHGRERFPASNDFPEALVDAKKLWSSHLHGGVHVTA